MLDKMGRRWAAVIVRNEALYLGIQHLDRCTATESGHDTQPLLWVSNQSRQQRGQRHHIIVSCVTTYRAEFVVIDGHHYDYCCAFDVLEPDGTRDTN